jgi:transposase
VTGPRPAAGPERHRRRERGGREAPGTSQLGGSRGSARRASVTRWKGRLERGGLRGLRRRAPPGRPSRLSRPQWARLLRRLRGSAVAAGFETERWTLRRIAVVVRRTFGVRYHPRSLGPALRGRGWSPQVPVARARERDDALVEAWLKRDWPRIKGGLAAPGGPSSSSTRRGTPSGPASAPPGRPLAVRPSCGA